METLHKLIGPIFDPHVSLGIKILDGVTVLVIVIFVGMLLAYVGPNKRDPNS